MSDKIRENILDAVNSFVPDPDAHSALMSFDVNGKIILKVDMYQCYSQVTYTNTPMEYLWVFFGEQRIKEAYKPEEWCDFVINRSMFKDAFITKCALTGLKEGFEINTHAHRGVMQAGMMMLRHVFERGTYSWVRFKEMGFTDVESYALSSNYMIKENNIVRTTYPANHSVHSIGQRYEVYEGKTLNYNVSNETLSKGFKQDCISMSYEFCGCGYYQGLWYPKDIKGVVVEKQKITNQFGTSTLTLLKPTLENVSKILDYLKGLK